MYRWFPNCQVRTCTLLLEDKHVIKRQLYSGLFTLIEAAFLVSIFYSKVSLRNEGTLSHILEFSVSEVQMLLSLVEAKSRRRSWNRFCHSSQ